jgi:nucleolar MIF4G domain-containing protein 1
VAEEHGDFPQKKIHRLGQSSDRDKTPKRPHDSSHDLSPDAQLQARNASSSLGRVSSKAARPKPPLRTPKEKQEDAYISYLEAKLGWVKGGKKSTGYGKGLDDDGLAGKCAHTVNHHVTRDIMSHHAHSYN